MGAEAIRIGSENDVDATVQVDMQSLAETARSIHDEVTVAAAPAVMRALGIPPQFEIDEKLLQVLTLPPPPRTTPIPMPQLPPIEVPIVIPLSRRPSRPPPRARMDDGMRAIVVAIWTIAALLFGVLAILVRSSS